MIDCIYVAASTHDARYTRICVASIRYFYPDIPVKLLVGGRLERGLLQELARYWRVGVADVPAGHYGWGFVKLEPLFGRAGERFLVLDSDTVLTGRVLDAWQGSEAPFLVDEESQTEGETSRLYYDWARLRDIDAAARPPAFVFNTGQWFGTAGILTREDFSPWLDWTMPRKVRNPDIFKQGEQGVLNYVVNGKVAQAELQVARRKFMHWPRHSMAGLTTDKIERRAAEPMVVHWAGLKQRRLRDMVGGDVLLFFERHYYRPMGSAARLASRCRHFASEWRLRIGRRLAWWKN